MSLFSGLFCFVVYEIFLYIYLYIHFSSPLIFLAPPLVDEFVRVASDATFLNNFNNNSVLRDNFLFLYDFAFNFDFVLVSNVEMSYFDFFFVEFFHLDFASVKFPSTTPFKDFFFFLNTFFFSMFIELDYEQPFLFRDIPVKDYHFKDFDFKAFDFVYQKQRPADYFFSC